MRLLVAASLICLSFSKAFGWGKTGHRIVGEIAQSRLNAAAREEITKLIGKQTLAQVSNWPDFIKSDPEKWGKSFPWHYVNVPEGDKLKLPKKNNHILTAIQSFSATLKNKKSPKQERIEALKFLVHIIGDLHQPLHVGKKSDKGGNDFKVRWFKEKTNLHVVWDSKLIDFQELSYTEYTAFLNQTAWPEESKWRNGAPEDWALESLRIRNTIYKKTTRKSNLEYTYNHEFIEVLNRRLYQAGLRLAYLLNSLL